MLLLISSSVLHSCKANKSQQRTSVPTTSACSWHISNLQGKAFTGYLIHDERRCWWLLQRSANCHPSLWAIYAFISPPRTVIKLLRKTCNCALYKQPSQDGDRDKKREQCLKKTTQNKPKSLEVQDHFLLSCACWSTKLIFPFPLFLSKAYLQHHLNLSMLLSLPEKEDHRIAELLMLE